MQTAGSLQLRKKDLGFKLYVYFMPVYFVNIERQHNEYEGASIIGTLRYNRCFIGLLWLYFLFLAETQYSRLLFLGLLQNRWY